MREYEYRPGIKFGGNNVNNLCQTDNTAMTAENASDFQQLMEIVVIESAKERTFLEYKANRNIDYIKEKYNTNV